MFPNNLFAQAGKTIDADLGAGEGELPATYYHAHGRAIGRSMRGPRRCGADPCRGVARQCGTVKKMAARLSQSRRRARRAGAARRNAQVVGDEPEGWAMRNGTSRQRPASPARSAADEEPERCREHDHVARWRHSSLLQDTRSRGSDLVVRERRRAACRQVARPLNQARSRSAVLRVSSGAGTKAHRKTSVGRDRGVRAAHSRSESKPTRRVVQLVGMRVACDVDVGKPGREPQRGKAHATTLQRCTFRLCDMASGSTKATLGLETGSAPTPTATRQGTSRDPW